MPLRSWALGPTWTTRLAFEARFPGLRSNVSAPRAGLANPPDTPTLEAGIDALEDDAIVRSQVVLAGYLMAGGRGIDDLPVDLASTAGALQQNTLKQALVELHLADPGRALPESVERMAQEVKTWATDLKKGIQLMDTPADDALSVDKALSRPVMPNVPSRVSHVGDEARRLLGLCW